MEENINFKLYDLVVLKEGNNNPLDYQNFKLYQIIDMNVKLNDEEVYIIQDVENPNVHRVVKVEEIIPFFIEETKKIRGFEVAKGWEDKEINLPVRKTKNSAGYDVEAAEDTVIKPFKPGDKPTLIHTGLKAYCGDDEWYMLANRSSNPGKKHLVLANGIGVIDSDYYGNPDNDGEFMFAYYNVGTEDVTIRKGDVVGQVVFQKFLKTDDDSAEGKRIGGFGSTDKEI